MSIFQILKKPTKNKKDLHMQGEEILYATGTDPITISKRLGHKQVSTTQNIYAHMVAKADAQASSAVASVLYGEREA